MQFQQIFYAISTNFFFYKNQNNLTSTPISTEAKNKNQDCKDIIASYKQQLESKASELIEVQQNFKNQEIELNHLKENNSHLQNTILKLNEQISNLTQANNNLKNSLNEQSKEIKKLQDKAHELLENQRISKSEHSKPLPSETLNPLKIKILTEDEIKEFEIQNEIGSGGCGKVFKVATKTFLALKEMHLSNVSFENIKYFLNEYEIMNYLNHPNILKSLGFFPGNEKQTPKILLEYCPNSFDNEILSKSLTKVQIVFRIYQIVEGMKYVHFNKIIHRDLKPQNILIADDGTVKIGDFGISKLMSTEDQNTMTHNLGTQKYTAPEIMDDLDYDEKVDVFSFGILVFFALNNGDISKIKTTDIIRGKLLKFPEHFTEFASNLITSCLSFEAADRPSFEVILNELEKNNCNLNDLSKTEISEVKKLIQIHKSKIPSY